MSRPRFRAYASSSSIIIVAASMSCLSDASARADYTPVGTPPGSEPSIDAILDTLYGNGHFTGVNWTNDTVSALRISDYVTGGDPLSAGVDNHLVFGGGNDQVWTDGIATFQGRARFAGYDQRFGIDYGASGTAGPNGTINDTLDSQMLDIVGQGFDTELGGVLSGDFDFSMGDRWGWYRDGTTTNSSAAALNPDASDGFVNSDHMITYQITGLSGPAYDNQTVWLLFWDDQSHPNTDRDFNDLVVELTAIAPVPAPGAALLGMLGLGLVGLAGRRRSKA